MTDPSNGGLNNEGFELTENSDTNVPSIPNGSVFSATSSITNGEVDSTTMPRKDNDSLDRDIENDSGPRKRMQDKSVYVHNKHGETEENEEIFGDPPNIFARTVQNIRNELFQIASKHKNVLLTGFIVLLFALYNAYLIAAIHYNAWNGIKVNWCDGLGFLIILTGIVYWSLFYYFILKGLLGEHIQRLIIKPLDRVWSPIWNLWYVRSAFALIVVAGLVTFLVLDTEGQRRRLISTLGIAVVILIGLLISKHPGKVIWRQVLWGLALQFIFGLAILRWEGGRQALDCLSNKVKTFLDFSDRGSSFMYGYLSSGVVEWSWNSNSSDLPVIKSEILVPTIFVFKSLSVIFFFSFFIQLLYHFGAMTWIVIKVGWLLQISVGTTAAESMNAAANIFLGQTEAPILVKPFLPEMTKSELHAVMTGGFATIAGTVMAAYISFGIEPAYLLSASVMAAPAALALSKLIYPETEVSKTTSDRIREIQTKSEGNALDAAAQGAIQGITLIGCIVANIIAFVSFVAFLNAIISWFGGLVGADYLSFEWILSKVFIPVTWIMGIDPEEAEDVALLLGLKTVVNEFVAYQRLTSTMDHLSPRSKAISTYALCSFANFSSIGIQLGGLGSLAPERRTDLANCIWRAFIAGTAAGILNACIAGTLLSEAGYMEPNNRNISLSIL